MLTYEDLLLFSSTSSIIIGSLSEAIGESQRKKTHCICVKFIITSKANTSIECGIKIDTLIFNTLTNKFQIAAQ